VITDLTASYAGGSQQIIQALNELDKETGRTAMRRCWSSPTPTPAG